VELLEQLRQVVRIRIHVVAVPRLTGAAMPTPIVGDAPIAMRSEMKHLRFPRVGAQWPTVAETNDLARVRAPVLIVDCCPIFRRDRAHDSLFPPILFEL